MMKNVVYNFMIPCFILELSNILYDCLMTSFCLQKVKKVYEADYVSKRKLTQRTFFQSTPGGGVPDLRMDGGLPPGFQKGTLF